MEVNRKGLGPCCLRGPLKIISLKKTITDTLLHSEGRQCLLGTDWVCVCGHSSEMGVMWSRTTV